MEKYWPADFFTSSLFEPKKFLVYKLCSKVQFKLFKNDINNFQPIRCGEAGGNQEDNDGEGRPEAEDSEVPAEPRQTVWTQQGVRKVEEQREKTKTPSRFIVHKTYSLKQTVYRSFFLISDQTFYLFLQVII